MIQRSVIGWLVVVIGMCAWPAWAVEYRLQLANLDYMTVSSYDSGNGNISRLQTRLDNMDFPIGALLPGREIEILEDPIYGGKIPERLSVLPTTKEQPWTTLIWNGNPGETFVFVVKSDMAAWQRVRFVAANPQGTLRQLKIGNPSLFGGLSYEVPEVSYDFLANAADQRIFPRWMQQNARSLDGLSFAIGQGHSKFYNPDRLYIVLSTPPEPRSFKVVVGWRDHDDRGADTNERPTN